MVAFFICGWFSREVSLTPVRHLTAGSGGLVDDLLCGVVKYDRRFKILKLG
jgi:hypothetical protein